MRNYHVITPFSRLESLDFYTSLFEQRKNYLTWHPIVSNMSLLLQNYSWVKSVDCGVIPGKVDLSCFNLPKYPEGVTDPCYWKLNYFIRNFPIINEDRYCFICDDDLFEPAFFEKIDKHSGELIICSAHRGLRRPSGERKHPAGVILGVPENMTIGRVGLGQILLSGKLLKTVHFRTNYCAADGELITALVKKYSVDYADEAFLWFNYFEPERWDGFVPPA